MGIPPPQVYSPSYWQGFWKELGARDVLWAQDTDANAMRTYSAVWFAGTTANIDRATAYFVLATGAGLYLRIGPRQQDLPPRLPLGKILFGWCVKGNG